MFRTLLLIIAFLISCNSINSQKIKELFVDTVDHKLDISPWLSQAHGFIPFMGIITEPAVGYGANLGALFVHKKPDEYKGPPGLSYAGGFLTENGSWGGVFAHINNWNNDKIRYLGVIGFIDVNLTYYPTIANEINIPLAFSLSGVPFIQKLSFRVGESDFFLGAKYSLFKNKVTFKREGIILPERERQPEGTVAGLGIVTGYDSRDNIFTPNSGLKTELILMHNDKYFGSDYKYSFLETYSIFYYQTNARLVSGIRLNYNLIWGNAPFYTKPFVNMRGIPAMRYQNDQIL